MAVINGTSGADILIGTGDGDEIRGFGGKDTINAGKRPTTGPIDVVTGGSGNDLLVVNASDETQGVQLFSGASPTFQVRSSSGNLYVDAYSMERVQFTGGDFADFIDTGTAGGSVNGRGGIDHWEADLGALTGAVVYAVGTASGIAEAGLTSISRIERITLTTGAGNDTITGGSHADVIASGAGADSLSGGNGDDRIDAGTRPAGEGIDFVDGGAGIDTLVVNASSETQTVQLFGLSTPTFGVRSASDNFYTDGFNMERVEFTGGAGADLIQSGTASGAIDGGAGIDHWDADLGGLTSAVTFSLGTTTAIAAAGLTSLIGLERITLTTGSGNDIVVGGRQGDTIRTGDGNDRVNAKVRPVGGDIDVVDGGAGTDILIINAVSQTEAVHLHSGSPASFQLRSVSGRFYVDATSMEQVRVTGGSAADSLNTGTGGGTVNGGGGNDLWLANLSALSTSVTFIVGTTTAIAAAGLTSIASVERITLTTGSGNDTITGGALNDILTGGGGGDQLTSGNGGDVFDFNAVTDSATGNTDSVTDFLSHVDLFDLSTIDANNVSGDGNQPFIFIGANAFGGVAGQLRSTAGQFEADVNGDSVADFRVSLTNGVTAVVDDFIL